MRIVAAFLALFVSVGTLLCCALPAFLVLIGFGAALAGFVSVFPGVTLISEYKIALFLTAGVVNVFAWRARKISALSYRCESMPGQLRDGCRLARDTGYYVLCLSTGLLCIGGFVAFLLPEILP